MPIIVNTGIVKSFTDDNGNTITDNNIMFRIFNCMANPFQYFFAKMGFQDAIKFVGLGGHIAQVSLECQFLDGNRSY